MLSYCTRNDVRFLTLTLTYLSQFSFCPQEGESKVVIEGKEHHLTKEDSLLVPTNQR